MSRAVAPVAKSSLKSAASSAPIGARVQRRPILITSNHPKPASDKDQLQRPESFSGLKSLYAGPEKRADEPEIKSNDEPEEGSEKPKLKPTPPKSLPSFTEKERDAAKDDRQKIEGVVGFNIQNTTLNSISVNDGQLLTSVSDAGFQHLLAGARANVGLLAGRYAFEVALVEHRSEEFPDPVVRIGFATAPCSLLLGSDADDHGVCFDWEGHFIGGGRRKRLMKGLEFGEIACVLLNLNSHGPNAHTLSLFRNGVRAADPQPLPESLRGQPLYPSVAFRGATIRVNLSEAPMRPLKFRCTSLQEAAVDDCILTPLTPLDTTMGDTIEVIFPVALPQEGFHDWVEHFLDEHKDYVEFSSRNGRDWINRSNISESGLASASGAAIAELVALSRRPCVVSEIRNNLTVDGRKTGLERFADPSFRKIAVVAIGEPPEVIKQRAAVANKDIPDLGENVWFHKRDTPDMPQQELALTFTDFALPEASEGFDEIRYEWQPVEKVQDHLRSWVKQCKLTSRIEDLQPSKWFQSKWSAWQKAYKDWEKKHSEWKSIMETLSEWKKEGGDGTQDEAATSTDPYNLEVFKVKDINDIGEGEPLFANFEYEDWCLMSVRFELHLLCHAFKKDVDDPQRPAFLEKHLPFYYELYYKKAFSLDVFNTSSLSELLQLIPDSVKICSDTSLMKPLLDESKALDYFLRMTEDCRRVRLRRTDAGDETAILKFNKPNSAASKLAKQAKPSEPEPSQVRNNVFKPTGAARGGNPPPQTLQARALLRPSDKNGDRGQPQARGLLTPGQGGEKRLAPRAPTIAAKQARTSPSVGNSTNAHGYGLPYNRRGVV